VAAAAESAPEEGDDFEGFDDPPAESAAAEGPKKDSPPEAAQTVASVAPKKKTKAERKAANAQEREMKENNAKAQKKEKKEKEEKKKMEKKEDKADKADSELETNVFAQAADLAEDDDTDMSEWVPLDLSPQLLSSIARLKFAKPTPIQARAIPHVMNGHDVIGKAATGSGKTLAFGIPIVEKWLARMADNQAAEKKGPIALILSPTRELAQQI
jgi:ATP-dependent RNA helicase DDX24/MAK5